MCQLFLFAEVTLAHFLVGQGDQRQTWEPEQKCTQIGSDGMIVVKKAKNLKIGKLVVGYIGQISEMWRIENLGELGIFALVFRKNEGK